MSYRINKAAVLGSGVMGTGIACHLANIGLEVVMLDIVPFNLSEKERAIPALRNKIVNQSLKEALKSKPAPLYDNELAANITTGNFEDDFHLIEDCDWIIEVVVERLDIKLQIFEKVESHRKQGSIVTSNTSGIPINHLVKGRSEDFSTHFCGTHFFNPPRYMRLLEIIPHSGTKKEVIDFFMQYGDVYLGKETVLCKDTPAFVANRIGFYSGTKMFELTSKYDLRIEAVDKLTGPLISRPKTGCFRLQDLVGFDTSVKVTNGVIDNCPNDEYVKKVASLENPKYMDFLLENKFFGDKSGQGFYKKTNERDSNGRRIILSLDLNTLEYGPFVKPKLESLKLGKTVDSFRKRLPLLLAAEDDGGLFLNEYFTGLFAYAANRVPEISDDIYSIDNAMKAGYAWDLGPFEYWDIVGVKEGAEMAISNGEIIPDWVNEMIANGNNTFYKAVNGTRCYYDLESKSYQALPGSNEIIHLNNYRTNKPILSNSECVLHDIGDGVLCLEFTSKSNAIGEGIGRGLMEAIEIAETGDWKGLVIGNNAKNFTVGANLLNVGMVAMQKDFKTLNDMVNGFQQICMRLRYSSIPVVTATQGYVFGGGCEILMHSDGAVCNAESYIGLVEVGVGLLPGGGGTKEFALRASEEYFPGDVQIPTLIEKFRTIATATVATSATQAFGLGYLQPHRDRMVPNLSRVLTEAKKEVLKLAGSYTQPVPKEALVLGRTGLAGLYTAVNEFYLGKYMSEYDVEIARKIAYVICGGDLTSPQKVSEQYLLDIEREAFLSLLGNQKTLERIQYMLQFNKPLRN